VADEIVWVKGVTYGTFRPDCSGSLFPAPQVADHDLARMAADGFNAVRTYTVPPSWFLDAAEHHGMRVMVGLAWPQHVAFLDDQALTRSIEQSIRQGVRQCRGHPAVLCYALGNEIPASIVRWHGAGRVGEFLRRLYCMGKTLDPEALFTYVNYPTTEYLPLSFLDFLCFNVYLESHNRLQAYLARLHNIAGEKPLLMAEIGLDSRRNGEHQQAEALAWQVETAFRAGCGGAFVFAWTDEWFRGGHDILDWDFGLTTRERVPKAALASVRKALAEVPFPSDFDWPHVSVIVCSYNGAATIRDTLDGLASLEYPHYEVIVVDDGSTDAVPEIAAEYDVRLISTENRGLSSARNTGWRAASGEIVAYIDDDAFPDPHWLHFLAHTLVSTDYVGVGGPNLLPPDDGPTATCVANAPGGPLHVLVTDTEAEHVPGCNMAFRRTALEAVGGFDPRFRAAGDDVDLCWKLQERGWKIGFCAAAMNWHHRRNTIAAYWKQQQGYGRAEALLEEKWPQKYNTLGHCSWAGRVYGRGLTESVCPQRHRIYQGRWGLALFQSVYEPARGTLASLPLMPEWFLLIAVLGVLALLGLTWPPLLWAVPPLCLAAAAPLAQAIASAIKADLPRQLSVGQRLRMRSVTALLHLLQPIARLKGRMTYGLTPWRRRGGTLAVARLVDVHAMWCEVGRSPQEWLEEMVATIREQNAVVVTGGEFDRWDLEVMIGRLGRARLLFAIEEHGGGRQMLRFRCWARIRAEVLVAVVLASALSGMAMAHGKLAVALTFGVGTAALASLAAGQTALAIGAVRLAVARLQQEPLAVAHKTVADAV
jgi:O-antigen biosynthesis protein